MSSFICNAKHFNSIESNLIAYVHSSEFNKYSFGQDLTKDDVIKFVDILRELNVMCVSMQYKHHYAGKLDAEIKEQLECVKSRTHTSPLTLLGLYNALCCVNYQIEVEHVEGLCDDLVNNTMPLLDKFIKDIAQTVVGKLPDDKSNTWEIN